MTSKSFSTQRAPTLSSNQFNIHLFMCEEENAQKLAGVFTASLSAWNTTLAAAAGACGAFLHLSLGSRDKRISKSSGQMSTIIADCMSCNLICYEIFARALSMWALCHHTRAALQIWRHFFHENIDMGFLCNGVLSGLVCLTGACTLLKGDSCDFNMVKTLESKRWNFSKHLWMTSPRFSVFTETVSPPPGWVVALCGTLRL